MKSFFKVVMLLALLVLGSRDAHAQAIWFLLRSATGIPLSINNIRTICSGSSTYSISRQYDPY